LQLLQIIYFQNTGLFSGTVFQNTGLC